MANTIPGKLVIYSGPSGVGKSTVLARVLREFAGKLHMSVSATTRPPRVGEMDGKNYHFLAAEEFAEKRSAGEFIECCEVFGRGYWYGTLESEVGPFLEAGQWVILEVDVEGAQRVLERFPDAETIFLRPSSFEELERRLRERNTETEEAIQRRLAVANRELELASMYRHQVINDDIEVAVDQVVEILRKRGLK